MVFEVGVGDILIVLPSLILWIAGLWLLIRKAARQGLSVGHALTVSSLACLAAMITQSVVHFIPKDGAGVYWNGLFLEDGLGHVLGLWVIFLSFITLAFWRRDPKWPTEDMAEILFLWLSSLGAALLALKSNDLLAIFVHLEAAFLPVIVMIGLGQDHEWSKESAIKYFIWNGLSTLMFLLGMALIYGAFGHLNLEQLAKIIAMRGHLGLSTTWVMGGFCLLISLLMKMGHFPFHFWVADVYQGAQSTIAGWASSVAKIIAFAIFMRFVSVGFWQAVPEFATFLTWFAVLGTWVGNLLAWRSEVMKRMLAYSGVANVSFLILAALATWPNTDGVFVQSGLVYLMAYTLASTILFQFVVVLERDSQDHVELNRLSGLGWSSPFWGVMMTIAWLSLAGLPPLWGFMAKFYVILDALEAKLFWPVVWMSLASIVGLAVYLKPVSKLWLQTGMPVGRVMVKDSVFATSVVAGLMIVFSGLALEWIIRWLNQF